ncbi:MAG TPA: YihY/virulence factor BrkB family protein [Gemmatimonadales bacterium]|nr:YihY/virulence factor BrkB family protein [Gemmatimonadales bacterium]
MVKKLRGMWNVLYGAAVELIADNGFVLAASIAFFTIFSLAPLLLLVVAVTGLVFGEDHTRAEIQSQFGSLMGADSAQFIAGVFSRASKGGGGVAAVISIGTLIVGATGVFVQLKAALNNVWGVQIKSAKPRDALMRLIWNRIASFAMMLVMAFLLLVSLAVSAALAALARWSAELVPGQELLVQIVNGIISFAVLTFLFCAAFKILPDVRIAWRVVWFGGAVTALLFTTGKELIGLYLGQGSVGSVYGAAGSMIVILLWVYYSSIILLYGAEATRLSAKALGWRLEPIETAEQLDKERTREKVLAGREFR